VGRRPVNWTIPGSIHWVLCRQDWRCFGKQNHQHKQHQPGTKQTQSFHPILPTRGRNSIPDTEHPTRIFHEISGRTIMVTSSWIKCKTHTPMTKNWNLENLVPKARPELHGLDGGFSVPAFASRASARQAVFPAAASLQTGFPLRSNTFQLPCFFFLTPES